MPTTSSTFDPNGNLQTTVEATPQNINTGYPQLADYVRRYQPQARVQAAALQPAAAAAPQHVYRQEQAPQPRRAPSEEDGGRMVPVITRRGVHVGSGWALPGSIAYQTGFDSGDYGG